MKWYRSDPAVCSSLLVLISHRSRTVTVLKHLDPCVCEGFSGRFFRRGIPYVVVSPLNPLVTSFLFLSLWQSQWCCSNIQSIAAQLQFHTWYVISPGRSTDVDKTWHCRKGAEMRLATCTVSPSYNGFCWCQRRLMSWRWNCCEWWWAWIGPTSHSTCMHLLYNIRITVICNTE